MNTSYSLPAIHCQQPLADLVGKINCKTLTERTITRRSPNMKHTQFFNDFLDDEVNLNQSRLDRLNTSVKAVSEFLSQNLDSYRKVEPPGVICLTNHHKTCQGRPGI